MNKIEKFKSKTVILSVAQKHEQTQEDVIREMEDALDTAWSTQDPAMKELQHTLFPEGKPTAEEFINTMAAFIKKQ